MNRAIITGNLGADGELHHGQSSGVAVLKLRVATSERIKKGEAWVSHTEWHQVTLFGKRAEALSSILVKGKSILVEGKLRTSSYEKNGEKRYKTEIIADDVELLGGKRDSGGDGREPEAPGRGGPSTSESDFDGDDIPFDLEPRPPRIGGRGATSEMRRAA